MSSPCREMLVGRGQGRLEVAYPEVTFEDLAVGKVSLVGADFFVVQPDLEHLGRTLGDNLLWTLCL